MNKLQEIPITFRLVKGSGDITAIFLNEHDKRGKMYECYEHIGQHGNAHKDWVNDCTFPCNPKDYQELYKELREIYEDGTAILKVVKITRL